MTFGFFNCELLLFASFSTIQCTNLHKTQLITRQLQLSHYIENKITKKTIQLVLPVVK